MGLGVQEFNIEIQSIDWKSLAPHQTRGDLLVAGPSLDLMEVGQAIANDQASKVKEWLNANLLFRPQDDQIKSWELIEEEIFNFVIVKPFVIVQLKSKN